MAFNFPACTYIIALIADAFLIFFSIFHVIAFDELKTDYKNPIDQCNSLNPVSMWLCDTHTCTTNDTINTTFVARFALNITSAKRTQILSLKKGIISKRLYFSWCCRSIYCIWCSIYCFCWLANGFRCSWMHRWLPIMCSGRDARNIAPVERRPHDQCCI